MKGSGDCGRDGDTEGVPEVGGPASEPSEGDGEGVREREREDERPLNILESER